MLPLPYVGKTVIQRGVGCNRQLDTYRDEGIADEELYSNDVREHNYRIFLSQM